MDKTKLFQIGEISKLFNISVSTLRHYEKIGLLAPEYTDPESGYRYYGIRQFEPLNTIRYLRALDMPLEEISEFLQNRDIELIEEKLKRQKAVVAEKRRKLAQIERKIDNRLRRLNDAKNSIFDIVGLKCVPECRAVLVEDRLKIENVLDMESSIRKLEKNQSEGLVFLGKVGVGISKENLLQKSFSQYDEVFLLLDGEDDFEGETIVLPETYCAVVRFCGSHTEAPERYEMLLGYIEENSLEVSSFSREITMIDGGLTTDADRFVTEISIPVTPKKS